jgi:hypothetical protein
MILTVGALTTAGHAGLSTETGVQAKPVPSIGHELFSQEFEELFEEHYVLVYRTAYGVTGRVEDAEDVVQTVFLRLLQRDKPRDFLKNP